MMTPTFRAMPSPAELFDAPERAILSALDATLVLAIRALKARHPDLDDRENYEPQLLLAEAVLACALSLHSVLVSYDDLARRTSRLDSDEMGEEDEMPF